MVISYSIQELYAIGEMMTITELLARGKSATSEIECNNKFDTVDFIKTFQKLIGTQLHSSVVDQQQAVTTSNNNNNNDSSNHTGQNGDDQSQRQLNMDGSNRDAIDAGDSQGSLTSSVAEFFRKAQQNFYAQASIDPTKVRRLSEIEAELIGASERNDSS